MANTIESFQPYLSTADANPPTAAAPYLFACMDERPFSSLQVNPDIQLAGGILGLGTDLLVTDAIANNQVSGHSPETAAKLYGQILTKNGIRSLLHEHCAGEELSAIAQQIVYGDHDALVEQTYKIEPGITEKHIEQAIRGYAMLLGAGLIHLTSTAGDHVLNGEHAIKRNPIVPSQHVAEDVVISFARTKFNTRQAFADDRPAYQVSIGRVPELVAPISGLTSIDIDNLTINAMVRHAATSLMLPHPQEGKTGADLNFLRYEEAA